MDRVLNRTTSLTGYFYHKRVWYAGLVLMVEEKETIETESYDGPDGYERKVYREISYRKATDADIVKLNIKPWAG